MTYTDNDETMLEQLTDVKRFAKDLKEGWIFTSRYEANPHYIVACYSKRTQFAGHWVQDTTLLARGLVLKLTDAGMDAYESITRPYAVDADTGERIGGSRAYADADVDDIAAMLEGAAAAGRGMRKFFTVEAATSGWGSIKLVDDDEDVTVEDDVSIDYDAPASVADKLDGALGVGTIIDGDYVIGTKGSFRSDEAIEGNGIMHAKHDSKAFAKFMLDNGLGGFTPLFEIITPNHFHVVEYGDMDDIVMLGLLHRATGRWIPSALLATDRMTAGTNAAMIPGRFGFATPDVYNANTLGEALMRPALDNHEGMVVTLEGEGMRQDMFKIKYPMFLMLQRMKHGMSQKAVRDFVKAMPATAIMHGVASGVESIMPENVLPDAARDAAKHIIAHLDGMVMDDYVMPIRDAVNEAIMLFAKASDGVDLGTREGRKSFAMRVGASGATDEVMKMAFGIKREAERNADGAFSAADIRDAAVNAAKNVML